MAVARTVAWLLCAAVAAQETPIDFDAAIASAEQALAALKQAKLLQEQRLHPAPPPPPPATPPLPPPKTSKDGRLLLALGVTCMPAGTQYRALSRELMARPGAAEGVAVRFVVGASARAALAAEASRHGDFLFVDCPEGGGFVKQVVAICKVVRFYAYATKYLEARFYGRFEDDHFVATNLLAGDLRGLAGSAAEKHLAYGMGMWLAYDPAKFWDGARPEAAAATPRATRDELERLADDGCYRGGMCRRDDRPGAHSQCPLIAADAPNLGLRESTFDPKPCAAYPSTDADCFPFAASAEVISASLATSVAGCAYARAFVDRAVGLVNGTDPSADLPTFVPGVDALSGHFWRRCGAESLRVAWLPAGRFHNAPGAGSERIAMEPKRQSTVVHGLKFYNPAVDADRWFRAAYDATKHSATTLPPMFFEFAYATAAAVATVAHGSARAMAANAFLFEKNVHGKPLHQAEFAYEPWVAHVAAATAAFAKGLEPDPW